MISKKLIQSTMFDDFVSSRSTFDMVVVDKGDDGVVVIMSAKALRIDARVGLLVVGLAVGFIVLLAGEVKDRWVGGIIGVDVDMLVDNENINGLAVLTTPSETTLPAPWEESIPFC